jgi:hypothetical protein
VVNTFADLPVPDDPPIPGQPAPTDGLISLRQAIALARDSESHGGDDTIILPHEIGGVAGTYALSLGELSIFDPTGKLTIQSVGGTATIDARHNGRAFDVGAAGEVLFQGLTITGGGPGFELGEGGGVLNRGTLTMTQCTVSGNSAFFGGGVSNRGTLTIKDSTVSGNSASEEGNGIENTGVLTITGSMIVGNTALDSSCTGGGVNSSGTLAITDSTVSGNTAGLGGGVVSSETLTINHSTVSDNTAATGGGIFSSHKVTITNSTFSHNTADAAIDNYGGTLTITGCDITLNNARGVYILGATGSQLLGNMISHNSGDGVRIDGIAGTGLPTTTNQLIGSPLAGNTIAFNGGAGVAVLGDSVGIAVRGNSIYANAGRGIDLSDDGLTPDSPGGPHDGPNHLQNFPVLAEVTSDGQGTSVQGLLNSAPNSGFLLDFYSSPSDGSNQVYVGSRAVVTDSFGNAVFDFVLPSPVPDGWTLTATATTTDTAPYGDTSEFASPIAVVGVPPITLGPDSLLDATAGVGYSRVLTASGGVGGPYTFSVIAGALPQGLTLSASGVLSGTSTTASTSAFTIAATDKNGHSGNQALTLTVDPAPAAIFVVVGFPSPGTAGLPGAFSVTALDAFNNVATDYSGTITFSSSDTQASLPSSATLSRGSGSFSATLKTAGSQSLTARDTFNPSLNASLSGIVVNPAATSRLVVGGFPSPVTAGVACTFTVTARDAFGNTTPAYSGAVHFTSSDIQAALPRDATLSSGTGIFGATLKTAASQSLAAIDTVNAAVAGGQAGIVVKPAAAKRMVIMSPSRVTHGTPFRITVTALDAYGNLATDYTGTVRFASSEGGTTLPGKYAFTASDNGVHAFTGLILRKKGTQRISVTDTNNGTILGTIDITVL